ncbi:hypothetical protein [Thermogymnomonas acidicola]|uniref:hypothetical protein n=1 Tax=Thermogymnomonas acidicola TaxID=399579 RepID=UPI001396AA33|nr:hypothetical protein [Thermogymnomonas acidicola]
MEPQQGSLGSPDERRLHTPPDLLNALKKAAAEVRAHDTVRVLGHYDGDGTSAVIILTRASRGRA